MAGRSIGAIARILGRTEEGHPYRCLKCDAGFDLQYHVCPECGSYSVEREWEPR